MGHNLAESLQEKTGRIRWSSESRDKQFVLFSKSKFLSEIENNLDDSWHLFSIDFLATIV